MQQPANTPSAWTASQQLLFRFFVSWFLLYIFFNPNGILPGVDEAYNFYITPIHSLITWIGAHILHLSKPVTSFTNGSGDTTYDFLVILLIFVLSALACIVWTLLDRKRGSYTILFYWVTTILRYYLGITMLSYGFAKVFKLQFPYPDLSRMLEPYGESSPMGLAWAYMGYSTGYNLFTGFAEVIAGSLLFFRRTTAIGAFIAFIVVANIMAMNYSFDIPVKLLSTTMVLMSLFLLGDNIRRLFNLFFLGRNTTLSVVPRAPIRKKSLRITLVVVKCLLVIYSIGGTAYSSLDALNQYGDNTPHTALYGIYNTHSFLLNNDTLAPLQTDTIRWKQLVVDGSPTYPYGKIKMMSDSFLSYGIKTDTITHLMTITDYADSNKRWRLHYIYPSKDSLILWGSRLWGKQADSIRIAMIRYPLKKFRLNSRGYHWINEYPYNR
jgi:uncharacterized membrane protein YphA (DoxX/SURF4 family)